MEILWIIFGIVDVPALAGAVNGTGVTGTP